MIRSVLRAGAIAALASLPIACSSTPDAVDIETPTTTEAPRHVDMSDRPHVTFDPCHHLGDEVMRSAGYDPGTKESTDFLADSYTTLGCMWKTDPRQYRITVLSSNFTADEQRERFSEHTTSIPVAGSEAIRLIDPDMPDECADIVATEFGAVLINRLDQNLMTGGATPEQRCAGMDETVEIILDAMNAPR